LKSNIPESASTEAGQALKRLIHHQTGYFHPPALKGVMMAIRPNINKARHKRAVRRNRSASEIEVCRQAQ
jgi:hypothetical protein